MWELNEAFAAQVLGCLAAWEDPEFCRSSLGTSTAPAGPYLRAISSTLMAGAIGVGHPVGASGNRIVLHLVNAMRRLGAAKNEASRPNASVAVRVVRC